MSDKMLVSPRSMCIHICIYEGKLSSQTIFRFWWLPICRLQCLLMLKFLWYRIHGPRINTLVLFEYFESRNVNVPKRIDSSDTFEILLKWITLNWNTNLIEPRTSKFVLYSVYISFSYFPILWFVPSPDEFDCNYYFCNQITCFTCLVILMYQ